MLVLSRRLGEEIIIGDTIRLKVVAVQHNRVRLAISAPADITVDRLEVHEQRLEFAVAASSEALALEQGVAEGS